MDNIIAARTSERIPFMGHCFQIERGGAVVTSMTQ
jgi:hypothetical protein